MSGNIYVKGVKAVRSALMNAYDQSNRSLDLLNENIRSAEEHLVSLLERRAKTEEERNEFKEFLDASFPGWQQDLPNEPGIVVMNIPEEPRRLMLREGLSLEEQVTFWTTPLPQSRNRTPKELWALGRRNLVKRALSRFAEGLGDDDDED